MSTLIRAPWTACMRAPLQMTVRPAHNVGIHEGHLLSFSRSDKAIPGTDQKCEVCNLRVSNPQSAHLFVP